jgi:hypothetical protein
MKNQGPDAQTFWTAWDFPGTLIQGTSRSSHFKDIFNHNRYKNIKIKRKEI